MEEITDRRIVSERILRETGWEEVDWIRLDQDRDQWQDLVNTVTKLWVP
jgi:hypothetical protein